MSDSRAIEVMDQQSQLEMNRSTWDSHYREVAERVLPRYNDFQNARTVEGEKRTEKIFDSTAPLAIDRAASAVQSLLIPSTQQWHGLAPEDDRLLENREVMIYLANLVKKLFRYRYRPDANFTSQAHESCICLMGFGTQGFFTDEIVGRGLRYKSVPVSELYISENHYGIVDLVHRKFPMSARAAANNPMFKGKLPPKIVQFAEKHPFEKFDFIHCVKPNPEYNPRRSGARYMQYISYYISCEGKAMLSAGGYRTMPYAVSRHVTAPREVYGRSPAMMVLPDIKMVNEMEKTMLRAAHKLVEPPLLVHGDGILNAFSTRPNALNYGGVDDQGRQLVHPLRTGSNLPIGLELSEQKRKVINDAFFVTLFQILVQNPQMTATEAMIRAQEKGQLLAPTVGRQESEWLGRMIEREVDILSINGELDDMPEELMESGIKIVYTSPLSRLRRSEDGVAILRTFEAARTIADIKPEVLDIIDEERALRELAEINGAPAIIIRDQTSIDAIRESRQAQQQQAADLEGAQTAANAAKNLAQAASVAGFTQPVTEGVPA